MRVSPESSRDKNREFRRVSLSLLLSATISCPASENIYFLIKSSENLSCHTNDFLLLMYGIYISPMFGRMILNDTYRTSTHLWTCRVFHVRFVLVITKKSASRLSLNPRQETSCTYILVCLARLGQDRQLCIKIQTLNREFS